MLFCLPKRSKTRLKGPDPSPEQVLSDRNAGAKDAQQIENELGIETFDIYGLTEIYGPGIALDCSYHEGMHYWSDNLLFEIIDPITGEQLPDGNLGELVITTLTKEGAPDPLQDKRPDAHNPGAMQMWLPFPQNRPDSRKV